MKYGYGSADAFSRAFKKQHGITPSDYRKFGGSAKVYPPVSFHIIIKGASEMNFRIIDVKETFVYGVSKNMTHKSIQQEKHYDTLCGMKSAIQFLKK